MSNFLKVGDILDSVSITHKFNKDKLIFLNTSDVLEGKILINSYMNIEELKGQAKKTIKNNDILYSEIRPKNKRYAYVNVPNPEDYVVSTKLMVLRSKNKDVLARYVYYFLINENTLEYLQNRAENRICSFPQITFDVVKDLELYVPTLKNQERIVEILDTINDKINLNNKINSELELMAKTLYDYWFVQFEFPNLTGKPYKSSGGKMIWNEGLKREIPEKWIVQKLSEIENNIVTGKTPPTNNREYFDGEVPFITIADIRGNMHITETENTLTNLGAASQNNKYIPMGAICVTCIASPGLVGFATQDSQTNQQINSIICKNTYNRLFLYFAIKEHFIYSSGAKTGNTFANMNKGDFSDINILHPEKNILKKFECNTESLINKILNNSLENGELKKFRDFLLPLLMNGQVGFKDAMEKDVLI